MRKPVKGHLSLVAIVLVVVGTCLVTGFFLFVVNGKTAWQEPPSYPNAQNITIQISNDKSIKTTNFTTNEDWRHVVGALSMGLTREMWYPEISNITYARYVYIDNTRNFSIPVINYEHWNDCPAFILEVSIEDLGTKSTGVKMVQSVGPCGSTLS